MHNSKTIAWQVHVATRAQVEHNQSKKLVLDLVGCIRDSGFNYTILAVCLSYRLVLSSSLRIYSDLVFVG